MPPCASGEPRSEKERINDPEKSNIQDMTISLDGGSFYGCTFNRCKLQFSTLLPITLDRGNYNDCNWEFAGPASNTVAFMTAVYKGRGRDIVEGIFRAIRGEQLPVQLRH
jgi:hypothetical protein